MLKAAATGIALTWQLATAARWAAYTLGTDPEITAAALTLAIFLPLAWKCTPTMEWNRRK